MRTATAKELRSRASAILENVRKGNEVIITMRGESIAVLKPFKKNTKKEFNPVGFGIWKNREDLENVTEWIDKRRKVRYQR